MSKYVRLILCFLIGSLTIYGFVSIILLFAGSNYIHNAGWLAITGLAGILLFIPYLGFQLIKFVWSLKG